MSKPTASTPVRQRNPLNPVSGGTRLLQPVGAVCEHVAEIEITSDTKRGKVQHAYFCRCGTGCYSLFGFDKKRMEATHYDIAPDFSSCDCPDSTYREDREGGCKHRRALKALVSSGKLPAIVGQVEDKQSRGDVHDDEEADALADACGFAA